MKKRFLCMVASLLFLSVLFCMFGKSAVADAAVCKLGDTFEIGSWEQNDNSADGAEPITWRIVEMSDGKATLLSENIIDAMAFGNTDASWYSSSVRTWLNDTFYNSAFSDSEKSFLVKKDLLTRKTDRSGFDKTSDYVYLLSETDINAYSDNIKSMKAKATASALKKDLFTDKEGNGYGYWWLRSPGNDSKHVSVITPSGDVYTSGCMFSYVNMGGIRPAIQIDLNKSGRGGNTLTINYLYVNGKTAAKSYIAGITSGEKYDVKSPEVKGYLPDKSVVAGAMGTTDVTVKVIYKSTSKIERTIPAPAKISCENGKVVLKKVGAVGDGKVYYGYSLKKDVSTVAVWSEGTEFSELVGGTTYYFFSKVTGSASYADAFSSGTAIYVDKSSRTIASPKILNFNHNAVAGLEISPNGGGNVTYGVSATNNPKSVTQWSKYPVFNGLNPGIKYYLFAKVAETDSFKEAYSYTEFTTTATESGTAIPLIKSTSGNIIEVEAVELLMGTAKYGISETADVAGVAEWSSSTVFDGLEPGKRYYIFVKIENNPLYTNDVCSYSSALTVSGVRKIIAPEVQTVSSTSITVKPIVVTGSDFVYFGISCENNADNVSVWLTTNTFENLSPDTEYYVFAKLSNGNMSEDITSQSVSVKTKTADSSESSDAPAVPGAQAAKTDESDKKSSSIWIFILIFAIVIVAGGTIYILIKKKIIFKNFNGLGSVKGMKFVGKIKTIFSTAFQPLKKQDISDDYDTSETDVDESEKIDFSDDDFDEFDDFDDFEM